MYYDCHVHSNLSFDSEANASGIIRAAKDAGVAGLCLTDHIEFEYKFDDTLTDPSPEEFDAARHDALELDSHGLKICSGLEVGIQPHLLDYAQRTLPGYNGLDFIIASLHIIEGGDPFYEEWYEGRPKHDAYSQYLDETLKCLEAFDMYDVIGHIGYLAKCPSPYDDRELLYSDYPGTLDAILSLAAKSGKGIEINTSAWKKHGIMMPGVDILTRFRELKGEIVTIGSDAHTPDRVGDSFTIAGDMLKRAGFEYAAYYAGRKPHFYKL